MVSSRCHNEGSTCWIFWYSPATNIHNEVSQVRSFPRCWWWWQISDTEMNALAEKGLAWRRGKHVHGRLVLSMLEWSVWIIFNWKRMIKGGTRAAGWAQFSLPPLDFLTRITFNACFPRVSQCRERWEASRKYWTNTIKMSQPFVVRALTMPPLTRHGQSFLKHWMYFEG